MPHQDLLFDPPEPAAVAPARLDPALTALARQLPAGLRLGTSSWSFPGWTGLVWAGRHDEATLAREGLAAYARHPLLRTVSLDRSYYRPMTAAQFAALAAQVPEDFRFVVKAPALISDGAQRDAGGRPVGLNPAFLDPVLTTEQFVQPVGRRAAREVAEEGVPANRQRLRPRARVPAPRGDLAEREEGQERGEEHALRGAAALGGAQLQIVDDVRAHRLVRGVAARE